MFVSEDEDLRTCARCGTTSPVSAFATGGKRSGGRDTYCRPCRSAYGKEHYAANRQRYIDQSAARKAALREERTAYLLRYFETHPCVDCGERDPVVLEFDHLGDKEFSIGAELVRRSWDAVLTEIAKCEVVCANRHRRRTARRRRSRRYVATR